MTASVEAVPAATRDLPSARRRRERSGERAWIDGRYGARPGWWAGGLAARAEALGCGRGDLEAESLLGGLIDAAGRLHTMHLLEPLEGCLRLPIHPSVDREMRVLRAVQAGL